MKEASNFASLSPRLLARKGGAKPAMRPQLQPIADMMVDPSSSPQDDLGWNDMGEDADVHEVHLAEVVAINSAEPALKPSRPKVVAQQDELASRFSRRADAGLRTAARRAAFTLRLDAERHLQLRLASTVSGRSAQSLLTEALDRMIDDMPEIRTLAENVRKGR
jgi:hypothetical protein